MTHKFIPYGKQSIDQDDIQAVIDTLRSDFLTTGPKITEFEQKFADYIGCKYALSLTSGTAALHAACFASGIQSGDEVITTPITFAATSNSILYVGAKPVFADIDPNTYNLNPLEVEKRITSQTKAIIAVDYTGQPAQLFELRKIAKQHHLVLIEDAAHSLGSKIKDKQYRWHMIGTISDLTTFSFHPVKHITTAEGGMVCTNDDNLYDKLLLFKTHGITKDPKGFHNSQEGNWYYEQHLLGYNYRMSDLQAALGISQLSKLNHFIKRRHEIASRYNQAFSQNQWKEKLTIPYQAKNTRSSFHIYVIKLNLSKIGRSRKDLFDTLRKFNIGVNVHYIPVYYHPYYQKLGYRKGICPIAENFYEEIITLPIHPSMTDEDVEYIIKSVKYAINN
ncbi:MAG: UDP-4-amino-4,6-dideoxy-N-acetyl-beta-L-altrosamine transaminase [Marinisporobacter sp.]|jgi:UDP-4-amino-4,6-dideoxy-N-acetyl-beta-L-altrosamine transaminase|nr:UDP-4-amino-4,6-dideoxy-N-acetyl-beta-L-altrosamine transaminase [Marinisporobacter sp.]